MFPKPIIKSFSSLKQPWAAHHKLHGSTLGPRFQVAEDELPRFVKHCPVTLESYHRFVSIRWSDFPERDLNRDYPQQPVSYASFAAACLIKVESQLASMRLLRDHLVKHPPLVWLLGFQLVPSKTLIWGFDADASLPTTRHLTHMLRQMPNACFQFLLDETVRLLREELKQEAPHFGDTISLDTKHILAWVKENNEKHFVEERYDPKRQPRGDKDCRLGCKKRHNRGSHGDDTPATPTTNPQPASHAKVGHYHWGYATGNVVTKLPGWGEFVLAEFTQTFDRPDVSYFHPLMQDTERRLGFRPHFGTFDAAFDAFYVYEHFHREDEPWQVRFAAVPFTKRNQRHKTFSEDGLPHCEADLPMPLARTFMNKTSLVPHQRGVYTCPLIGQRDACPIAHPKWEQGGCVHKMPTSIGARIRHQIDRDSPLYKDIYRQRSATERINSQAFALGIEQPKLRNQQSITNQNTLIYVVINLRALDRVRQRKAKQASQN